MKKYIFVEPNLKNFNGHPYEGMFSIDKYLLNLKKEKIQFFLIGHKKMEGAVIKSFSNILPLMEKGCFEKNKKYAAESFKKIINLLDLNSDDIIIVMTSHLNELRAIEKISQGKQSPNFILQIHQFYPPLKNSDLVFRKKKEIALEFRKVLSKINWQKVRIATTPVKKLNKIMNLLSPNYIEQFPVPFSIFDLKNKKKKIEELSIGFLGDGRKEKGILPLFQSFLAIKEKWPKTRLTIQLQKPRGFTDKELINLRLISKKISLLNDCKLINMSVNQKSFYSLLSRCNLVMIPYDPNHYKIRLSGIAIQCAIMGIPIITTKNSWPAQTIKAGEMSGLIFDYSTKQEVFQKNLIRVLKKFIKNKDYYLYKAKKYMKKYQKEYSPSNYINNFILK